MFCTPTSKTYEGKRNSMSGLSSGTVRVFVRILFCFSNSLFKTSININIAGQINSQIITLAYTALFYIFFLISDKKFDHVGSAPQNPVIINKRTRFEYVIFDKKIKIKK